MKCTTQLPLNTELDIRVEAVADHARPRAVELELALHGIHHCLARLPESKRLLSRRVDEGNGDGSCAEEEVVEHRQGRVDVRGEERSPPLEIMHPMRQLQIVHMIIQPREHDAHLRIQKRPIRDARKVSRRDVAPERLIRAADELDALGLELLLDAELAEDVDLGLVGGQGEDAGDVDGGGVGRAEDVFDVGGDAEGGELFEVLGAGLGGVVCDEDGSLACERKRFEMRFVFLGE